jgi:hypothetical protein
MNTTFWESLAPLLQGWTVEAVAPHPNDPSGSQLTVVRAGRRATLEILSGSEGPLVGRVRSAQPSATLRYESLDTLERDIVAYVRELEKYGARDDEDLILPADDPRLRCVGFRCSRTGVQWLVPLSTLKETPSEWRTAFSSPDARAHLAAVWSVGERFEKNETS